MTPKQIELASTALIKRGDLISRHDAIAAGLAIGSRIQIFAANSSNQVGEVTIDTNEDLDAAYYALRGRFQARIEQLDQELQALGVDTTELSTID